MKAYEYKIVDGHIQHVEKSINELAQQGWSVVGTIQVRMHKGDSLYTQAMARPTEQKTPYNQ